MTVIMLMINGLSRYSIGPVRYYHGSQKKSDLIAVFDHHTIDIPLDIF